MYYRIHEKTTDEGWHLRTVVQDSEIIPVRPHIYLPSRDDLDDVEHSALEEAFWTGETITMGWTMVEPVQGGRR